MSTDGIGEMRGGFRSLLRVAALIATMLGAVGSVALMFRVGHRNPSMLLMALFTGWVLAPFVGLVVAEKRSTQRSAASRAALHGVMLALTVVSLAIYGNVAVGPPRAQPAFWFLVVPAASWLSIGIVVFVVAMLARRPSR